MIEGAPGHGEGHNSGQAVNIAAALAVKEIMQREKMPGTLVLWPGVAEEELAGKAFLVRAGVFKDVDVVLFTHVGDDLGVSWGAGGQSALISARVPLRGDLGARRWCAVARAQRARRRDAHGAGMGVPARAHPSAGARRTTSSRTAAISLTSCRAARRCGSTSASRTTTRRWSCSRRRSASRRAPR